MDLALFERKSDFEWHIKPFRKMHVPGVIFASESLLRDMDAKVYEQVTNVAMLPGIVEVS
jgi:tRNA-splicing ligase RtcB